MVEGNAILTALGKTGLLLLIIVPMIISFIVVPFLKRIGIMLGAYAVENERTVHKGKIVRIGGVAIYLSFMITMSIFSKADIQVNGILYGGTIIFLVGLVDDMIDLPAFVKLGGQILAALVAMIVGGVRLDIIYLPFQMSIDMGIISMIITFFWIIGITNAINLIDGLDGLSTGISIIVLGTISFIGFMMNNLGVTTMALVLLGAALGFLPFNFHPAKIFVGDCGALFLGYMIACFSLLGFKTATFITLGFPVVMLFVPISDTLIAIIRRKLKGISFSTGDREHLHHILMYKLNLGHRNAVLALYTVTGLFALTAIVSFYNETFGMIMLLLLVLVFELFVEATGMINKKFHPLMGLSRRICGYPKKKEEKE